MCSSDLGQIKLEGRTYMNIIYDLQLNLAMIQKNYYSQEIMDSRYRDNKGNNDDIDGDMSLNSVVYRTYPSLQFESTKEPDHISCKKRKTDASSTLFSSQSSSVDRHHVKPKMFEFSPSSIEELDLELRLGNRSKV